MAKSFATAMVSLSVAAIGAAATALAAQSHVEDPEHGVVARAISADTVDVYIRQSNGVQSCSRVRLPASFDVEIVEE